MMRKPLLTSVTVRFFGGPGFGPDDSYPSINNNGRRVETNEFSFLTIERFIIRVRDSPFSSRTSVPLLLLFQRVTSSQFTERRERERKRGKKGEIGITTNKANESIRS